MEEMLDVFMMEYAVGMKKDLEELCNKFKDKPEPYVYSVFCTFMDFYMHTACGHSAEECKEARASLFSAMELVNEEYPM